MVLTRRPMGCQFLKTHNVAASTVFGCNTNVQIGEPCHIYYNAAYAFKDTQKEDSERFLRIGTQVIRRLRRMEAIARENAQITLGTETWSRCRGFGGEEVRQGTARSRFY